MAGGGADATREHTGRRRYRNQRQYREVAAAARRKLGDRRYDADWNAGTRVPTDDAVAESIIPIQQVSGTKRAMVAHGLTAREVDVLRLIVEGATDKEIATKLSIAVNTVSNGHVRHILEKLGVRNRAAAVAVAVRERIV